jgi:hypothetical protein
MALVLALVCFFAVLGGLLAGQSLKALLLMKLGLEKAQRKMFLYGLSALGIALVLALLTLVVPLP